MWAHEATDSGVLPTNFPRRVLRAVSHLSEQASAYPLPLDGNDQGGRDRQSEEEQSTSVSGAASQSRHSAASTGIARDKWLQWRRHRRPGGRPRLLLQSNRGSVRRLLHYLTLQLVIPAHARRTRSALFVKRLCRVVLATTLRQPPCVGPPLWSLLAAEERECRSGLPRPIPDDAASRNGRVRRFNSVGPSSNSLHTCTRRCYPAGHGA